MRCLVTLCPDDLREPYGAGVRGLADVAEAAGWKFLVLGDEALQGEAPWQAHRLAIRRAFELGAERVCWCDADVVVRKPKALAAMLNADYPAGVWSTHGIDVEGNWLHQFERNGQTDAASVRVNHARDLYRSLCRGLLEEDQAPFPMDWLVVYAIPAAIGLRLCDVWDEVAIRWMRAEGLQWGTGLSIGLAASTCRVPVRYVLNRRRMNRAIFHLVHSCRTGRYLEGGACAP